MPFGLCTMDAETIDKIINFSYGVNISERLTVFINILLNLRQLGGNTLKKFK